MIIIGQLLDERIRIFGNYENKLSLRGMAAALRLPARIIDSRKQGERALPAGSDQKALPSIHPPKFGVCATYTYSTKS